MLFFSKLKRDWKECDKCNCDEKKKENLEINSNRTFPLRSFALNFWIYLFIFLFLLSLFALTLSRDKTNNTENDRFVFQRIHGLSTSLCIVNTSCITCLSNNNAIPKDASSSFPQPHYKQTLRVFPTLCSQATNLFRRHIVASVSVISQETFPRFLPHTSKRF